MSPKINTEESWIYGYHERFIDSETGNFTTVNDRQFNFKSDTFKRRLTGNFSMSFSTKLYGMFSAKIFSLNAIRHIISPSVSYSYKPDFSKASIFGIETNYFQVDQSGEKFDLFSKSLVSNTPQSEYESYSLSIKNDFHGKFYDGDKYVKIPLISTSTSASYRPQEDNFKWSLISTSIYKNTKNMNIDVSVTHDLYKLENGQRVSSYSASPRLINLSSGFGFNVTGKKIERIDQSSTDSLGLYDFIKSDYSLWDAKFIFRGM